MYESLVGILDVADRAIASAIRVAPPGVLDRGAAAVSRLRNRLDYPDDLAIVALAGGTGSGKSSLFNALLESDEAEVGGTRPTTSRPLVSAPDGRLGQIEGYLDWLGDHAETSHDSLEGIVLIDLPDTDSIETAHRLIVDSIVLRVDTIIWVVDVEKYRDASLHRGMLGALSDGEPRFLFALNQIDRLPSEEVEFVFHDFIDALVEDGFLRPRVFPVAARPPIGPVTGIDDLREALEVVAAGSTVEKVAADLSEAISEISASVGSTGSDFEARWATLRDEVATAAASGDPVAAGRMAASFFADFGARLQGEAAEEALRLSAQVGERLRGFVRGAVEAQSEEGRSRLWPRWGSRGVTPTPEGHAQLVSQRLDELVDESFRPRLRERAEAIADLALLATAIEDWRHGIGH